MFSGIINRFSQKHIYACMCVAESRGTGPYPLGERHALIAMIKTSENDVEESLGKLLAENGWMKATLQGTKKLDQPFQSEDRAMMDAFGAAAEGRGGLIVYQDPVRD